MRELRIANGELRVSVHAASAFGDVLVRPCSTFAARDETGKPLATIQLSPAGRVQSTNGDFVMDRAAFDRVEAKFREHRVHVPIDVNHELVQDGIPPKDQLGAVGWIVSLAFDERDGLTAKVEWKPDGEDRIRSGRFPYLSPTFYVDKESGEIMGLHSAGLVVLPAIPGMKKLAAGQKTFCKEENMEELKLIGKEFGLAEAECKVDVIVNKIGELKKAKAPTEDAEIAAHVRKSIGLGETANKSEVVLTLSNKLGATTELAAMKQKLADIEDRESTRTAEAIRERFVKANKINPNSTEAMTEALAFAKRDAAGFERFMAGITAFAEPGRTTGPSAPTGGGREAIIANSVKEYDGDASLRKTCLRSEYVNQTLRDAKMERLSVEESKKIAA